MQRILALTAAIWHNDKTGQATLRSLVAYDHCDDPGGGRGEGQTAVFLNFHPDSRSEHTTPVGFETFVVHGNGRVEVA